MFSLRYVAILRYFILAITHAQIKKMLNGYFQLRLPWTEAQLCLIFKKRDKMDPANYRGISLLNCILKIFTAMLTKRLQAWIEDQNLMNEDQFDFRAGRSCSDAIYTLYAALGIIKFTSPLF